jgi:negative regulator of flagellin synthesis FlgM
LLDGEDGGFDAAKVDRIRQSISDGTYKINAEAIADKLIANAQEVLGKVSAAR